MRGVLPLRFYTFLGGDAMLKDNFTSSKFIVEVWLHQGVSNALI